MNWWQSDKDWSDRFIPEIKQIVGPHLLVPSNLIEDQKQATDLKVLVARNLTIACRVRRPHYYPKYKSEFTIRYARDSGAKTEYQKLKDGWGDWMFYGFSDKPEKSLIFWCLLNLESWREQHDKPWIRSGTTPNGDGTYFKWFDVRSFKSNPPLVIASLEPIQQRQIAAQVEFECFMGALSR